MNKNNRKRLYPKLWQHDYHVLTQLRREVIQMVQKYINQKKKLIDYGCGDMPYREQIQPYITEYIGVDIGLNPQADILIQKGKELPIKTANAGTVLSTQVLEHVDDVDLYLRESYRILEKGGYLFLSTHGIWPYHEFPNDYRRWTKYGLEYEIQNVGFQVIETRVILGAYAASLQFQLLLFAKLCKTWGIAGRLIMISLSLVGNVIIALIDMLERKSFDAAVFIVVAQK